MLRWYGLAGNQPSREGTVKHRRERTGSVRFGGQEIDIIKDTILEAFF